jgi:hypothetical protein
MLYLISCIYDMTPLSSNLHALPAHGMLVQLPRAVHFSTAQKLAEQVTVGMESLLEAQLVSLPLGMVLAARASRQNMWPAELTPAPKSALSAALLKALKKINR